MAETHYTLSDYNRLAQLALAAFDYVNATGPAGQDDANTTALNLATNPGEYERWADLASKVEAGLIVKLYQAVEYLEK